jgi:hypothetical protein
MEREIFKWRIKINYIKNEEKYKIYTSEIIRNINIKSIRINQYFK